MTNYAKGAAFERACKKHIESFGWFVQRSPQSRSKTDLICLKKGCTPLFIQCKVYGVISRDEWNELYVLAHEVGVIPVLAYKKKGKSKIILDEMISIAKPHQRRERKSFVL